MKLREAIANIDRSDDNETYVNVEPLAEAVGLYSYYTRLVDWEKRVKSYWLIKWCCTDTWVGSQVVFFDDRPFAMINQSARKNPEEVEFIDKDMISEFRSYLADNNLSNYTMVNMDEEIGEYYTVAYSAELLTNTGIYNGEPVIVAHRFDGGYSKDWRYVIVTLPSGENKKIHMDDFHIPYGVMKA